MKPYGKNPSVLIKALAMLFNKGNPPYSLWAVHSAPFPSTYVQSQAFVCECMVTSIVITHRYAVYVVTVLKESSQFAMQALKCRITAFVCVCVSICYLLVIPLPSTPTFGNKARGMPKYYNFPPVGV